LSDFNEAFIFWTDFRKKLISNLIKIPPVGGELFHGDRRTDGRRERHDEANSRFSLFFKRA